MYVSMCGYMHVSVCAQGGPRWQIRLKLESLAVESQSAWAQGLELRSSAQAVHTQLLSRLSRFPHAVISANELRILLKKSAKIKIKCLPG